MSGRQASLFSTMAGLGPSRSVYETRALPVLCGRKKLDFKRDDNKNVVSFQGQVAKNI